MKKWLCVVCGLIYDEAKGWPSDGIPPGTRWEDVPEDWECPECGVSKAEFEMVPLKSESKPSTATSTAVTAANTAAVTTPEPTKVTSESPIVIVGSGYAGYGLAEAIRKRSPDTQIVVFTADDGCSYSKPSLSNAFARSKTANDLVNETPLTLEQRLNIRIHNRCRVHSVDTISKTLETDSGSLGYSKLVLATGADPIRLPLAGSGAQDVLSVNDLQGYRILRERLSNSTKVMIIGNGLIGCEFANDFATAGHPVDVVGLDETPMGRLLPKDIGLRLQGALSRKGVGWHQSNTVERIEREGGGYRVILRDGTELDSDLIISAIGLRPRTQLAESIGAEVNRGIKVNGGMRTNVQDVFAIGDCVEINNRLLPYIAPINHGIKALADILVGKPTMVQYPLMPVIVKTPALPLTLLAPPGDAAGQWHVEDQERGARALYIDEQGLLQGFVLAGDLVSERQYWLDRYGQESAQSVA